MLCYRSPIGLEGIATETVDVLVLEKGVESTGIFTLM